MHKETGYDGGQVTIVFPRFTGGHFASQRPSQPDVKGFFNNSILESMFCTCCGAQVQISFAFCPSCGESLRNDRQTSTDRGGSTCAENVMIETLRKSNSPRRRASSSGMDQSRAEVLPKTKRAELLTYAQFATKSRKKDRGISNRRCQNMENMRCRPRQPSTLV